MALKKKYQVSLTSEESKTLESIPRNSSFVHPSESLRESLERSVKVGVDHKSTCSREEEFVVVMVTPFVTGLSA